LNISNIATPALMSIALLLSSFIPLSIYNVVAQDWLGQEIVPAESESESERLLKLNFANTTRAELPPDLNTTKVQSSGSVLKLEGQKVAVDIPLQKAYENGSEIYFVVTDASDKHTADIFTNITGFKVNFAALLANTPESARSQAYVFENGMQGDGPLGFQTTITNANPEEQGYSPLYQLNFVKWKNNDEDDGNSTTFRELRSAQEIIDANQSGQISINQTNIVMDFPAVKWNGGSLKIRADKSITNNTPFEGGQVTRIDTENMIATFVAMRAWGPDGKTLYWIATDATPLTDDITRGGIVYAPANERLAATPVAVDFYQFLNGIEGSGPQGFQPPISSVNIEDEGYSPIWRIYFVYWKDPSQARVLQTVHDITQNDELLKILPALGGKHIVNCAFFSQETLLKHKSDIFQ
jgi:hypothetical protein